MKSFKRVLVAILTIVACVACCFAVACDIKWTDSTGSGSSSGSTGSTGSTGSSGSTGGHTYRYQVLSVKVNSDYNDYLNAKSEKENKQSEFYDRTANFKAGDDNALRFAPDVQFEEFVDDSTIGIPCGEPKEGWNYIVKVALKRDDGNFVELTTEEKDTYIDVLDDVEFTIDFSEDAVGCVFEVSVTPDDLTDSQKKNIDKFTAKMTVEVVDGYNVYDAKELSLINNAYNNFRSDVGSECWKKFKEDNGISLDLVPSGIVMQKNITITKDDLPEGLFFTEEQVKNDPDKATAAGSLKDWARIYVRNVARDENFAIEGNYFKLDASKIPLVVRPRNEIAKEESFESHSTLFFIHTDEANLEESDTSACIRNINLVGNSPRSEKEEYSGGLLLMKSDVLGVHAYNTISYGWFIGYFANGNAETMIVEKCKGYDYYSSLFYVWGGKLCVKDSEFVGAGGPAFIVDHTHPTSADGGTPSSVITVDSNIHSYVAGTEAWFVKYKVSNLISAEIKTLNPLFIRDGQTTFLYEKSEKGEMIPGVFTDAAKVSYLDLIAVYKSGDAAEATGDKITGYYNTETKGVAGFPMDFGTYEESRNPYKSLIAQFLEGTASVGAPAFITNYGGIGSINEKYQFVDGSFKQITDKNDNLFKGDNLYLIYNRMGIVLGYESLVQAQA